MARIAVKEYRGICNKYPAAAAFLLNFQHGRLSAQPPAGGGRLH
jgi:hypothetical protein